MVASLRMAQLLDWPRTLVFSHIGLATILQRRWWWLLRLLVLGLCLLEQVGRRCIYQYLLPRLSLNLIWFCVVRSSEIGWITHSAIGNIFNRQDFSAQVWCVWLISSSIKMVCFKGIIGSSIKCRIRRPDKRRLSIRQLPLFIDKVSKPCVPIDQGNRLILIDWGLQLQQVLLNELLVWLLDGMLLTKFSLLAQ